MRKLMAWVRILAKHNALLNVIISVLLTIGRWLLMTLPTAVFAGLSVLATLAAYVDKESRKADQIDLAGQAVLAVLAGFLREFTPEEMRGLQPRVILYLADGNENLSAQFHVNVKNERELALKWLPGQGCVGLAYTLKTPVFEDCSRFRNMTFEQVTAQRSDSNIPWVLSREHWESVRDLGSILGVPVPHPTRPWEAIGTLTIDSCLPLKKSGLDSDAMQYTWAQVHAPCIAEVLHQFGLSPK